MLRRVLGPHGVALLAALLLTGGLPASAGAATFYVDGVDAPGDDCSTPGKACASVEAAAELTHNDINPGPDTVQVAAGTYEEDLHLYDGAVGPDAFAGLTIDGTGSSGPDATRIVAPETPEPFGSNEIITFFGPMNATSAGPGVTFRLQDLSVETAGRIRNGIEVHSSITELVNVNIDVSDCACLAAEVEGSRATLNRAIVDGSDTDGAIGGTALAFRFNSDGVARELRILDSSLTGSDTEYPNGGGSALAIGLSGLDGVVTIERSRLSGDGSAGAAVLNENTLVAESSVFAGDDRALYLGDCVGDSLILSSTLVSDNALTLRNCQPGSGLSLRNSLALGSLTSEVDLFGRENTLTCLNSELHLTRVDTPEQQVACDAPAGNAALNPGATFIDHLAGDYRLRPCAAAVDSGAPGPLYAPDARDAVGAARVVDGDLDGAAHADRGALEHLPAAGAQRCGGSGVPEEGGQGNTVDRAAPAWEYVALRVAAFRARRSGGPFGRRGARLVFLLSEPARVSATLERRRAGRMRRLRGVAHILAAAGTNERRLTGRWRGRRLAAGVYRLRLVAVDAAGNRSAPRYVRFRILPPR